MFGAILSREFQPLPGSYHDEDRSREQWRGQDRDGSTEQYHSTAIGGEGSGGVKIVSQISNRSSYCTGKKNSFRGKSLVSGCMEIRALCATVAELMRLSAEHTLHAIH